MRMGTVHTQEELVGHIRRMLAINALCTASDTRFELLRASVWGLSDDAGKVHVNRLLSACLAAWQALSERLPTGAESSRRELHEALLMLEDAGDLLHFGNGYYAPATTRLVSLPQEDEHLLVGGLPSSSTLLNDCSLSLQGPYRRAVGIRCKLSSKIPEESFESWTRLPDASLREWAQDVLDATVYAPYSPTDTEPFEFYDPGRSRLGTPQFRRWSDKLASLSGPVLARRVRHYGAREYRLLMTSAGRITGSGSLHDVDVRRLMYSLDLKAHNPVYAQPMGSSESTEWLLTSELPRAEQRAFSAFGSLTIPDDRPYQRRWNFVHDESSALHLLQSLGVVLKT